MRSVVRLLAGALMALLLAACGSDDTGQGDCPPGQVLGPDGRCRPAGNPCPPGEYLVNGVCYAPPCPPGELLLENGTCRPAGLPPDRACEPGELELEDGSCLPAGFSPEGHPAGVPPDGCGEGFVHDGDRGCEPILPAEPCPPGQMAVPGDTECHEVVPCGNSTYGHIPVDATTQFVDASYLGVGDGSPSHPWTSIQDGVDAASPGAIVAVATGTYIEWVTISGKPVRLWGRCPAMTEVLWRAVTVESGADGTEIRSIALSGSRVLINSAADVVLDGVWVHEESLAGIYAESPDAPSSLTVRNSLVEDCHDWGVNAKSAAVTIERTHIRDILPRSSSGIQGFGVAASPPAVGPARPVLTVRGSVVERVSEYGIGAWSADVVIEDSVIRDVVPDAEPQNGNGKGLYLDGGESGLGSAVVRGSLIERATDTGVVIVSNEVSMESTVVRDVLPTATRGGLAIVGQDLSTPSKVQLRASLIEGAEEGVQIVGSELLVEATAVRDLEVGGADRNRHAVGVLAWDSPFTEAPSVLTMQSSLVEQVLGAGILLIGSEGLVEAAAVRDIGPGELPTLGGGVLVMQGEFSASPGDLTLRGSSIDQTFNHGVWADGSMATIEGTAVHVVPTAQTLGRGVSIQQCDPEGVASQGLIRSCTVEGFGDVGVFISGAAAVIESSVVRAGQPGDSGGIAQGIHIRKCPASGDIPAVTVSSVLVEDVQEAGVHFHDSQATIEGSVIRRTLASATGLHGDGMIVLAGDASTSARVQSTRIEDSARAGLSIFGAHVLVGESALTCQSFDVNGEPYLGTDFLFEDLGGNFCGCPEATASCLLVSAELEPPAPADLPPPIETPPPVDLVAVPP